MPRWLYLLLVMVALAIVPLQVQGDVRLLWRDGASGRLVAPANVEARQWMVDVTTPGNLSTATVWDADAARAVTVAVVDTIFALSPDGKWFASCNSQQQRITLRSLPDLLVVAAFSADAAFISFTGDSQHLVLMRQASAMGGVEGKVVRVPDGTPAYSWTRTTDYLPRSADVSRHHPNLLLSADGQLRVHDVQQGTVVYLQPQEQLYSADFSPDGRFVVAGGVALLVLRFPEGTIVWYRGNPDGIRSILDTQFTVDGASVVSLEEHQDMNLYLVKRRAEDGAVEWSTNVQHLRYLGNAGSLEVPGHGHTVLLSSPRGIWEYSLTTGEPLCRWSGHHSVVSSLQFSADGNWIASASSEVSSAAQIILHDAGNGNRLLALEMPQNLEQTEYQPLQVRPLLAPDVTILSLEERHRWHPDNPRNRLRLRSATDGSVLHEIAASDSVALADSREPDTVVYREGGDIKVWNAQTGETSLLYQIEDPSPLLGFATVVQHQPVYRRLTAIALAEEVLLLSDAALLWRKEIGDIRALAFSPDGKRLATVQTEAIHLWDTATGERVMTLFATPNQGRCQFSHDGAYLWVQGSGSLFVFRVQDGALVDEVPFAGLSIFALSPTDYRIALSEGWGSIAVYSWTPPQPRTLRVNLTLDGLGGEPPHVAEVRMHSLHNAETVEVQMGVNPDGSFTLVPPAGWSRFTLSVRTGTWLRRAVEVDLSRDGQAHLVLPNGDIDGDNEVTLLDFGELVRWFGWTGGISPADLNRDNRVDLLDFAILMRNFGLAGDE